MSQCTWHAELFSDVGGYAPNVPAAATNSRSTPEDQLYVVWCGDVAEVRWLSRNALAPSIQPVVDELVRRVTVHDAGVDVRPDNRGVTGIPSLFWVDGYGAGPIQASESAFGLTVDVSVALVGVEWDFGDGSPVVTAGLGEAWPERSSVQHNYWEVSGDGPYVVTARLHFQPTYTVNGTPGGPLAPIVVPVTRDYLVRQVQAERVR